MHGRYAANSRLANSSLIRGAFHLGKKPGNFGGSISGIFDWYNVVPFGRKPRYLAVFSLYVSLKSARVLD